MDRVSVEFHLRQGIGQNQRCSYEPISARMSPLVDLEIRLFAPLGWHNWDYDQETSGWWNCMYRTVEVDDPEPPGQAEPAG
jgi:hypothetical protein